MPRAPLPTDSMAPHLEIFLALFVGWKEVIIPEEGIIRAYIRKLIGLFI
jgi:hypothetical protein